MHHCSPLEHIHDRHMCILVIVRGPCKVYIGWLLPPQLWLGGALCYSTVLQPFQKYGGVYSSIGFAEGHPISLPSLHGLRGIFFPRFGSNQWHGHIWIMVDIKTWGFWCGDGVSGWWVYLHQVGSAFCCLITHLSSVHRQGVITNPLPTWTRMWRLFCSGPSSYRFWARSGFHPHCLYWETEWDASFEEPDVITSSVSSGLLYSVPFLILLNHSLLLASNLKCYSATLAGKM